MNIHATDGYRALTEKEKQTLRLIVRGHDAKSTARHLGLSVHTINERLRDARRKLSVSSSREAARLLFEREAGTPEKLRDMRIGEAATVGTAQIAISDGRRILSRSRIATGATLMILTLGFALIAASLQSPSPPAAPHARATFTATLLAGEAAIKKETEAAARAWLALLDESRWSESYAATGSAFRKLNTAEVWADASRQVRSPLGAMASRTLLSQENLPAPPNSYEVVKFRTSFANRPDAVETVTLDREDGIWRVVGVRVGSFKP